MSDDDKREFCEEAEFEGELDEDGFSEEDLDGLSIEEYAMMIQEQEFGDPFSEPSQEEIEEEDEFMRRRQNNFYTASQYVTEEMCKCSGVQKIAVFGSVAKPLEREVPRFRRFRQAGIKILHECKDVDLAVWVFELDDLRSLQKARSHALNTLLEERNIGVAHHQVDVFLLDAETDRYLGRLCRFSKCPKEKKSCQAPGCGEPRFLRVDPDFRFDWKKESDGHEILYDFGDVFGPRKD